VQQCQCTGARPASRLGQVRIEEGTAFDLVDAPLAVRTARKLPLRTDTVRHEGADDGAGTDTAEQVDLRQGNVRGGGNCSALSRPGS
jgi:hypothetical protein